MSFLASFQWRSYRWWAGLASAVAIAWIATLVAAQPAVRDYGFSALTVAIVLGLVLGNTVFPKVAAQLAPGVDFAKGSLLRIGIVLYGFRLSLQDIAQVGWTGVLIAAIMVAATFWLAVKVGTKWLGMDRDTAMLIGAGASICGAAAVIATEPVVRAPSHKVSVAVATVVVFGTLGMFLYPAMYPLLGLTEHAYGIYVGSSVHEVAQVVAAGKAISDQAASTAVIEKMLRVMMLAPFLLILSKAESRAHAAQGTDTKSAVQIPWFAVLFIAVCGLNSLHLLPQQIVDALIAFDTLALATAMAALGLRTHVGAIKQAGMKPLVLAAILFLFLMIAAYALNRALI
ncbi:YeiH family protein [Aquilutibacter rugosus]|uniref:YeiH family protein n=1 Tax=Aquilutibacter rugosus TaxID=3115820 RepID=UPI002F418666